MHLLQWLRLYAEQGQREVMTNHYDEAYFAWQKDIGEFGGWANAPKFLPYVKESDTVLEFGCGGGYLLRHLRCNRRIGVEINQSAREAALKNGIEVFESTDKIPVNVVADKIISNHALEHTQSPLQELLLLKNRLKPGGRAIFVVPCESISRAYSPNDINKHLYTWNPMCLGNLFIQAGFQVIHSKPYLNRWPPMYRTIARLGGRTTFELASTVYGHLRRSLSQVHLVATK
jgi:SAM-dependent methyltransferase